MQERNCTYFLGYPGVKTGSSLPWDQTPSPVPLFPVQLPRDMDEMDMDEMDMEDVLPSAGLFASTSQGTGQPGE